jgi:hypothetical protein
VSESSQRAGASSDAGASASAGHVGVELEELARKLHPVAAAIVILLVFVQVYLIAAFVFGEGGALATHMTVGRIAVGFELAVLATALIGYRHDRTELGLSAALVLVGALQVSLAEDLGGSPQVHAFHGLLALVVLTLAWRILARSGLSSAHEPRGLTGASSR